MLDTGTGGCNWEKIWLGNKILGFWVYLQLNFTEVVPSDSTDPEATNLVSLCSKSFTLSNNSMEEWVQEGSGSKFKDLRMSPCQSTDLRDSKLLMNLGVVDLWSLRKRLLLIFILATSVISIRNISRSRWATVTGHVLHRAVAAGQPRHLLTWPTVLLDRDEASEIIFICLTWIGFSEAETGILLVRDWDCQEDEDKEWP